MASSKLSWHCEHGLLEKIMVCKHRLFEFKTAQCKITSKTFYITFFQITRVHGDDNFGYTRNISHVIRVLRDKMFHIYHYKILENCCKVSILSMFRFFFVVEWFREVYFSWNQHNIQLKLLKWSKLISILRYSNTHII